MEKVVKTFLELVRIDSPSGEEEKMAERLKNWLRSLRFVFHEDKAGNIIAYRRGTGKPLLMAAHMDTVEPGRGIRPVIVKGVIRSSGDTILGADDKAAIAAIITATERYLQEEKRPRPIELIFTVKEEIGGGAEFLDVKKIKSRLALIFDISGPIGSIVLASPYIYNFRAVFQGRAAHIKELEKGRNAILPATAFISSLPIGRSKDGSTTLNVGKVSGGKGINIVPETVEVQGEVRSFDRQKFHRTVKKVEQLAKTAVRKTGVRLGFSLDGYCPGYSFSKNDPDIRRLGDIVRISCGRSENIRSVAISDANPLNEKGIKTINLSYGGRDVHSCKESIRVKDLERLEGVILECLESLE